MASSRRTGSSIRWPLLIILAVGVLAIGWWTRSKELQEPSGNSNMVTAQGENANQDRANANTNSSFSILPDQETNSAPAPKPKTSDDLPKDQGACESAEGEWLWREERCWPNDEASCEAFSGLWGSYGPDASLGCSIRAADGGQVCSDSSECLGLCIVSPGQIDPESERDDEISNVSGTCTPRLPVLDCVTALTNGRPSVVCP